MSSAESELASMLSVFDESVYQRLQTLNPPILRILWLSHVLGFLTFVHHRAHELISDLDMPQQERRRLSSWYLDDSIDLLRLCDVIRAEAENLRMRCLVLSTAANLVRPRGGVSEDQLRRVKDHLSGVDPEKSFYPRQVSPRRGKMEEALDGLRLNLEKLMATTAKASAVKELLTPAGTARMILLGVGVWSLMLGGLVASAFTRSPMPVRPRMAPGEFRWSETFNTIELDISRELRRKFGRKDGSEQILADMEGLERRTKQVLNAMGDDKKDNGVAMRSAVRELFRAKERVEAVLQQVKREENALFMKVTDIRNEHLRVIL
ncbi:hypothetical protein MLD38_011319 [Melastoma candidum]|uniref:Uncharacterized protein n=1 Tax=Melastoma candidum TaxID=119954 RepID=A0ACB9R5P7_9MYRT|nr:hypothetical protein MLD38_011319 [Melastoma candidum]